MASKIMTDRRINKKGEISALLIILIVAAVASIGLVATMQESPTGLAVLNDTNFTNEIEINELVNITKVKPLEQNIRNTSKEELNNIFNSTLNDFLLVNTNVSKNDTNFFIESISDYISTSDDNNFSFEVKTLADTPWQDPERGKRLEFYVTWPSGDNYYTSFGPTSAQVIFPIMPEMRSDFKDVIFYDSNGNKLDYYILGYIDEAQAVAWVKIPSMSSGSNGPHYLYYNNNYPNNPAPNNWLEYTNGTKVYQDEIDSTCNTHNNCGPILAGRSCKLLYDMCTTTHDQYTGSYCALCNHHHQL